MEQLERPRDRLDLGGAEIDASHGVLGKLDKRARVRHEHGLSHAERPDERPRELARRRKAEVHDDVASQHVQIELVHGLAAREDKLVTESRGARDRFEVVALLYLADNEKARVCSRIQETLEA